MRHDIDAHKYRVVLDAQSPRPVEYRSAQYNI